MFDLSSFTKITFFLFIFFAILWFITPKDKIYETVEMETVSLKKVFLLVTLVSLGFFLASLGLW